MSDKNIMWRPPSHKIEVYRAPSADHREAAAATPWKVAGDHAAASPAGPEGVEAVCVQCGHYAPPDQRLNPTLHRTCYELDMNEEVRTLLNILDCITEGGEVRLYEDEYQAVQRIRAASPAGPEAAAATPSLDYSQWVERVAQALHDDCELEWQAIVAVDPSRQITMHMSDAHYGKAHDLVRRLDLARLDEGSKDSGRPNEVAASATPDQGKGEPR